MLAIVSMLVFLAVSASAAEYSAANKSELNAAISSANETAEDDVIILTGADYTGTTYNFDGNGKITVELTQNTTVNASIRIQGDTNLVFNLNTFELRNESRRQGNAGTMFFQSSQGSRLEVYNGSLYINDVCFWLNAGELVCQDVDVTASE